MIRTESPNAAAVQSLADLASANAEAAVFKMDWTDGLCRALVGLANPSATAVRGLESSLDAMPHDGFVSSAIRYYSEAESPAVRDALMRYLERFLDGHGIEISALLFDMDPSEALPLLVLLGRLELPESLEAMKVGLRSPHWVVRIQALATIRTMPAQVEWEDLEPLLMDVEDSIRHQLLEFIAEREIRAAGLAVARRITSHDYDRLPLWERKLLLRTAAVLSSRRAEALAIGLLNNQTFFSGDNHEQSRSIAAEFLQNSDSDEALEAVQRHARGGWRNSAEVRESASSALRTILQRRQSSNPPPITRSSRPPAPGGIPRK